MKTYTVQWEIELDAESSRDAAELALEWQRDPNGTATVFTVVDEEGNEEQIDLMEEEA